MASLSSMPAVKSFVTVDDAGAVYMPRRELVWERMQQELPYATGDNSMLSMSSLSSGASLPGMMGGPAPARRGEPEAPPSSHHAGAGASTSISSTSSVSLTSPISSPSPISPISSVFLLIIFLLIIIGLAISLRIVLVMIMIGTFFFVLYTHIIVRT